MVQRIVAIIFIYFCVCVGWVSLGSVMKFRTTMQDSKLKSMVGQLWGAPQKQTAPEIFYQTKVERPVETKKDGEITIETRTDITNHPIPLDSSALDVGLFLDHRKKGLLWYSTYRVQFAGEYTFTNPTSEVRELFIRFPLPIKEAVYDNFSFTVGGRRVDNIDVHDGAFIQTIPVAPGEKKFVKIGYSSQGVDQWWYDFGSDVTQVNNFSLNLSTNFHEINFPENSISPTHKKETNSGWNLAWKYNKLLSGVKIGMEMPQKLNPGPWVSSVTYAAPVSLFLFFFLMLVLSTLKKVALHPMHYFFIGASFFSFHILLAYLVDHISIHTSFLISSIVSIGLVTSYLRIVAGKRFAFLEAGIAQFVYLVLFSYTFFFEEYTGLAITALSILTLFIVMQITAGIDWASVFSRNTVSVQNAQGLHCPYCRGVLYGTETRRCVGCGTLHHDSCFRDHGHCAIFGCNSAAPPVLAQE
jgi:inner membrane protein involved in colicin E2 resistance